MKLMTNLNAYFFKNKIDKSKFKKNGCVFINLNTHLCIDNLSTIQLDNLFRIQIVRISRCA